MVEWRGMCVCKARERLGSTLSCLEMFFNKGFAGFHLCRIERIDLGNLGDKVWAKFDGMIIGMMRGELVMGFLQEDIHKVFASFRYDGLN